MLGGPQVVRSHTRVDGNVPSAVACPQTAVQLRQLLQSDKRHAVRHSLILQTCKYMQMLNDLRPSQVELAGRWLMSLRMEPAQKLLPDMLL